MGMSRFLIMFAIIIMMAMLIVWERNKTYEIGYHVANLQKECAELTEKNRKLNYYVSVLKSTEIIALKVQTLNLPLTPEGDTQLPTGLCQANLMALVREQ